MDNIKKQLRFFQVLVVVLSLFVLAQCSFWLKAFANPTGSNYNPVQKIETLDQQRRVIAPCVLHAFEWIHGLATDK